MFFSGGEFHSILVQVAFGKSTLLRLIANLENRNINKNPSIVHSGSISWLGQTDALLPWLNVLSNALLSYQLRGENLAKIKPKRYLY